MNQKRSQITTHVLDAALGLPAVGVSITLEQLRGAEWITLVRAVTDADGRVSQLGPDAVPIGRYRVIFDTGEYFAGRNQTAFYPEVTITFDLSDAEEHYHVPLLLSPFAYSTYRGS